MAAFSLRHYLEATMVRRSIVYVDGFNLYYGAIKGGPHKWLDLERYFRMLRPGDEIVAVKYFTALIDGPRQSRQETYLAALASLPSVTIILGKFKKKTLKCGVRECQYPGSRLFQSVEEKQTDVNVALHLLDDGYDDRCDQFIITSGDSDLVPAIRMVRATWPAKRVFVYIPARSDIRGAAVEIRSAADKARTLPLELLRHCHLPPTVQTSAGPVRKPQDW
jgi:uncharacterized LabA/DUF88 family protein